MRCLLKAIRDFYEYELEVVCDAPAIIKMESIAKENNEQEAQKLVQLVLGCAVQCERRCEFIQAITDMDMFHQNNMQLMIEEIISKYPSIPPPVSASNVSCKDTCCDVEVLKTTQAHLNEANSKCEDMKLQNHKLTEQVELCNVKNQQMGDENARLVSENALLVRENKRLVVERDQLLFEKQHSDHVMIQRMVKQETMRLQHANDRLQEEMACMKKKMQAQADQLDISLSELKTHHQLKKTVEKYKKKLDQLDVCPRKRLVCGCDLQDQLENKIVALEQQNRDQEVELGSCYSVLVQMNRRASTMVMEVTLQEKSQRFQSQNVCLKSIRQQKEEIIAQLSQRASTRAMGVSLQEKSQHFQSQNVCLKSIRQQKEEIIAQLSQRTSNLAMGVTLQEKSQHFQSQDVCLKSKLQEKEDEMISWQEQWNKSLDRNIVLRHKVKKLTKKVARGKKNQNKMGAVLEESAARVMEAMKSHRVPPNAQMMSEFEGLLKKLESKRLGSSNSRTVLTGSIVEEQPQRTM